MMRQRVVYSPPWKISAARQTQLRRAVRSVVFERLLGYLDHEQVVFNDLRRLLLFLGFNEKIHINHHIFYHSKTDEILNLQPKQGCAKPYQVKQVRDLIAKYGMGGDWA